MWVGKCRDRNFCRDVRLPEDAQFKYVSPTSQDHCVFTSCANNNFNGIHKFVWSHKWCCQIIQQNAFHCSLSKWKKNHLCNFYLDALLFIISGNHCADCLQNGFMMLNFIVSDFAINHKTHPSGSSFSLQMGGFSSGSDKLAKKDMTLVTSLEAWVCGRWALGFTQAES